MNPNRLPLKESSAMKVEPIMLKLTYLQRITVNVRSNMHESIEVN